MFSRASLRRVFLRVMLMALAAAAAAGFLAMLLASYEIVGRVAATALATALASGLLWRAERSLNERHTAVSGMLGMAATGSCFLIALVAIWVEDYDGPWWRTLFAIGVTTPAALGCLRLMVVPRKRIAGAVGISLSLLIFLVWLARIWLDKILIADFAQRHHYGDTLFSTTWTLAGFGILITLCLVDVTFTVRGGWRWVGVVCAALGCLLTLQLIWSDFHAATFREHLITVLTSVAIVVVHANLALLVSLTPRQQWVRRGAIGAAIVTASCLDIIDISDLHGDNLMSRLAGAMAIVAGCGTLALVVLDRYNRLSSWHLFQPGAIVDPETLERITVFCPRCNLRQAISLGEAHCGRCALRINVQVSTEAP